MGSEISLNRLMSSSDAGFVLTGFGVGLGVGVGVTLGEGLGDGVGVGLGAVPGSVDADELSPSAGTGSTCCLQAASEKAKIKAGMSVFVVFIRNSSAAQRSHFKAPFFVILLNTISTFQGENSQ